MIWRVSPSGDRAFFQEEVLDFSVLAFVSGARIYAAVRVVGVASPAPFEAVYGPFAHFSALTDAVAAFLLMVEADDDDGRVVVEIAEATALPDSPPVPANRAFTAEMMAPGLFTDLLWEAQQLLDTGADAAAGVGALEAHYGGERYDSQSAEAYREQGRSDTLTAVPPPPPALAAPVPVAVPAPVVAAAAPTPAVVAPAPAKAVEIAPPAASDLRPITTRPRLDSVAVGAVPSRDTGMVTNMPRAAVPKADPFVVVDWSTLPVHVVEEKLSRDFSRLRSQWRQRASVRV